MTLAGLPATIVLLGTSFVTTEPAPTITSLPIVIPGSNIAPLPIKQLSPILTSAFIFRQTS